MAQIENVFNMKRSSSLPSSRALLGLSAAALLGLAAGRALGVPDPADAAVATREVSWLGMPRFESGRDGSWIERYLEERFSLSLEGIFIDWNSYQRRKPLMMLGGDVPDVFWSINAVELKRDAYHGFALELPYGYLLEHAPRYVEELNRASPAAWLLTYYRGGNYGLPTYSYGEYNQLPVPSVWRVDWLRSVGMERMPETLEEMEEALWLFRHADPDRNGQKDTYGVCPFVAIDRFMMEVFAAYGALPGSWVKRGERLVWGGVQPEAKEALGRMREWFREGLIYPDYFLFEGSSLEKEKLFLNGTVGYYPLGGVYTNFDLGRPDSLYSRMRALDPEVVIEPGPPPLGAEGERGILILEGGSLYGFGSHLEERMEVVARVLGMFDTAVGEPEVFLRGRIGKRGLHWQWNREEGFEALPPFDKESAARPELLGSEPEIASDIGFYLGFGAPRDLVTSYARAEQLEFDERYRKPEWGLRDPLLRPDTVPLAEKHYRDLEQLQQQAYAAIISGEAELSHFDAFRQRWMERGGRELTESANELYSIKQEILEKVHVRQP